MKKEINFCRPDNSHYCTVCCQGRGCTNLGKLEDGSSGCLGHTSIENKSQEISQTEFCKSLSCLTLEDLKHSKDIVSLIRSLPEGNFSMQEVLESLNLRKN